MSWIRSRPFLRAYRLLPHRLLNRGMGLVARARRPRFAVDLAIRAWIRRDAIDLADFEPGPFASLDALFLRRLRPGARPLADGFVSPVDGRVVVAQRIADPRDAIDVKGRPITLERLVNGRRHGLALDAYAGGACVSIFLSPRGYHRIHMPVDGTIDEARWLPGRYFPQNEQALAAIAGVYERNERAVLSCRTGAGERFLLVLVGASLVGGIHLAGVPRAAWVRRAPAALGIQVKKGNEIGHFAFGSTVAILAPPALGRPLVAPGDELRLGARLLG